ncbi:MAG: ligand-binding sensor domain-containing protein, partial [Flammeovirgaceae bacterium]
MRNWTTDDGLPSSTLLEVVQGADGYIWMSSYDGLIRFDGHVFHTLNKRNGKKLQSNRFSKLVVHANQEVWIGTNQDGLLQVQRDTLVSISEEVESLQVHSFCIDSLHNRVWLGTRKGLYFLENQALRSVQFEGVTEVNINDIHQDEKGAIWVATEGKGLSKYEHGKWETLGLHEPFLYRINGGSNGKLWVCHSKGLFSIQHHQVKKYPAFDGLWTYRVIENAKGDLLVATIKGLCRITKEKHYEWLQEENGLPDDEITDMTFDREGSLWLSTYRGGLVQLAEGKFDNYGEAEGLTAKGVSVVAEIEPGVFWVGGINNEIHVIQDGKVSTLSLTTKLPSGRIYALLKDRQARVWIATYYGLILIMPDGKSIHYTHQNGFPNEQIRVLLEDSQGNIWVGTKKGGLVKIDHDLAFQLVNMNTRGLSDDFIMDIVESQQQQLLVATNNGGLNIVHPDLSIEQYTVSDGLPSNLIFNIHIDAAGIVWLATKDGISRFDGKKFVNIQEEQGLPSKTVYDILEDDYGFFWMSSSTGVIKVAKESLNAYAAGNRTAIHWQRYDKQDGMSQSECTAATSSLKATDGTLWFPTLDGVSVIHPKNDKINQVPPYVKITAFSADNTPKHLVNELLLNASTKRLVFEYAGLSLLAPDKVHYRYKLEGFDEVLLFTDERKAIYTNLQYGTYTFKVWASNNDGIWSEEPAQFTFSINRPYWAQWWFVLGSLVLIITLGVIAHKVRVHTIKEQRNALEAKVLERTKDLRSAKERVEATNKRVVNQNQQLEQQQEEILAQRDEIEAQNKNLFVQKNEIEKKNIEIQRNQEVIEQQNNQLRSMNLELESKVQKRTIELQRAYQELLKAHKQVDHFTYRSAHDLKGPIARLLGLCYLGRMEVKDELGLKYMNMLEGTAQQMGSLLNKLLQTHEIRTTKIKLEVVNLNQLIQSIWDRLHGFSDSISFSISSKEEVQHRADRKLIAVLFENLIQNALQYQDRNKDNSYLKVAMEQDQYSTMI